MPMGRIDRVGDVSTQLTPRFVVDGSGTRTDVLLPIEQFEKLVAAAGHLSDEPPSPAPVAEDTALEHVADGRAEQLTQRQWTGFGEEEFTIHLTRKGAYARGRFDGRRMLVLKGSTVARDETRSMPSDYRALRHELIGSGVITEDEVGDLTFAVDYPFSSPSAAANVIEGGSRNGYDQWKDAAGKSLKERGWSAQ